MGKVLNICQSSCFMLDPYGHKATGIDNALLKFNHLLKCFHSTKLTGNLDKHQIHSTHLLQACCTDIATDEV